MPDKKPGQDNQPYHLTQAFIGHLPNTRFVLGGRKIPRDMRPLCNLMFHPQHLEHFLAHVRYSRSILQINK